MHLTIRGKVRAKTTFQGLPQVLVSNGQQVARTASDGTYELQADPDSHPFVWVSQPAGFRTDGPFFRTVPEREDAINFDLIAAPERAENRFRLVQITDTHVEEHTPVEVLRQDLQDLIAQTRPGFIVHSGDLTNRGTLKELRLYCQAVEDIDTPLFALFGNHDGGELRRAHPEEDRTCSGNFGQVLGPAYYSFDWGDYHFVLYADMDLYFSAADRARKAAWLQADLEMQPAGRPSIVVVHAPPATEFVKAMSAQGVRAILYGHLHANKAYSYNGTAVLGTAPLCFGGIDTSPAGYRILDLAGQKIGIELRAHQTARIQPHSPRSISTGNGELALLWEHRIPGDLHRAAPLRWQDRILLSLRDENLRQGPGIRCLDAASGAMQWEFATAEAIKNKVAAGTRGYCAVLSAPGRLYVLEAASGALRWQRELPHYPERWIYTAPVLDEEAVYAGAKMGYGAFDLETGETRWYTPLEANDYHACFATPHLVGAFLVALVPGRGLVALDRKTGAIAWTHAAEVNYGWGRPALAGDILVSGGNRHQLVALNPASGEVLWQRDQQEEEGPSGLTAAGDRFYCTTPTGHIRCHDLHTGQECWRFQTGQDLLDATPYSRAKSSVLAPPVVWRDKILAGGNDGVLYVLDPESGTGLGQTGFGASITAAPCALDKGLCVGTWDGRLYCYGEGV